MTQLNLKSMKILFASVSLAGFVGYILTPCPLDDIFAWLAMPGAAVVLVLSFNQFASEANT